MTAGRELDALVAEKVMGWQRGRLWLHAPDSQNFNDEPPTYSTDMAAAWAVVEQMITLQWQGVSLYFDGQWFCQFIRVPQEQCSREVSAYSDTAPHAICLAALKAVGVRV